MGFRGRMGRGFATGGGSSGRLAGGQARVPGRLRTLNALEQTADIGAHRAHEAFRIDAHPQHCRRNRRQQPHFACAQVRHGRRIGMDQPSIANTPIEIEHVTGAEDDAGDDPDVTHGALIKATVSAGLEGSGVTFRAGEGVGTATKPGLPVPPGEPAINPVPRAMIRAAVTEAAEALGGPRDVAVEISIPGGEALAQKTLNSRLGIVGGLSILGTTGIVVPYSCAAWIHSIHRGIDVARATGLTHVAGSTVEAFDRIAAVVVENVARLRKGDALAHRVA